MVSIANLFLYALIDHSAAQTRPGDPDWGTDNQVFSRGKCLSNTDYYKTIGFKKPNRDGPCDKGTRCDNGECKPCDAHYKGECITKCDNQYANNGKLCQFPINYKGVIYHNIKELSVGNVWSWCFTERVYAEELGLGKQEMWGTLTTGSYSRPNWEYAEPMQPCTAHQKRDISCQSGSPLSGQDYSGAQNITQSGHKCMRWGDLPKSHDYNIFGSMGRDFNACRNPNSREGGVWCFTGNSYFSFWSNSYVYQWDYCTVRKCPDIESSFGWSPRWSEGSQPYAG